jgi:hypothetical protein
MGIAKAQTAVNYSYDSNGNRILRTISLPVTKVVQSSLKSDIDSSYLKEEIKGNEFEDQINEQRIFIYPNPTHGELRIKITGYDLLTQSSIRVYNLKGSLVTTINPLTGNDIVNLSSSPLGTYVVKIQIGDKISEWKVVKE